VTDTVGQRGQSTGTASGKRRGRRPGGTDTRAALLQAAREVFAEQGYDGATVRMIATRAGVDAAMVNHWFGSKEGLFVKAVLQLPIEPATLVDILLDGPPDTLGERIVRTFLTTWDTTGGGVFAALVRSVAGHEQAAHVLTGFFFREVFRKVVGSVAPDRLEFRAGLVGSQVVGMGMTRYVLRFEPFASAEVDTLVAAVAPTIQRYLTGTITSTPKRN
jgi:AcrR family transcriptional regulator